MKKILLGLLFGAVLFIPATVSADYIVRDTPWTKVIYKNSSKDGQLSVFDDAGNKCYIVREGVYGGSQSSISCVKQ